MTLFHPFTSKPKSSVSDFFRQEPTKLIITCLAGILGGIFLLGLMFAGYSYWNYRRIFVSTNEPVSTALPNATPSPTPDPLAPFGVLVMGFGGPAHDGGYLTDTMILAYIEHREEKVTLISLPRDLWVNLPVTETEEKPFKINHAYAIGRDDRRYPNKPTQYTGEGGGGALAKKVVQDVTGLPVNHFVALSFEGFKKSIDVLGGVQVSVPVTFEDPLYPIESMKTDLCGITEEEFAKRVATLSGAKLEESFECRYETLHFEAGRQLMDGETALKYVRSRHSPTYGGDFARSERQKSVISALKNQVLSVQFLPKLVPFISSLTRDMQMDIELNKIQEWISQADQLKNYEIKSIEISDKTVLQHGTSADRQYILMPKTGMYDWTSIHEYIQAELDGRELEEATAEATLN